MYAYFLTLFARHIALLVDELEKIEVKYKRLPSISPLMAIISFKRTSHNDVSCPDVK